MLIDQASLLIAIAFSSAALMLALLIGWLNARQETYLAHGSGGIGLVVIGVAIMGLRNGNYDLARVLLPYLVLLAGFSLIFSASRLFVGRADSIAPQLTVGVFSVVTTTIPFLLGYSGVGTMLLNVWSGVIMLLCARLYWQDRHDGALAMIANAALYTVTASSFLACALVIGIEGQWVLNAPPRNWAEDFNSIMSLVGLTGIGAITLTLHHARTARRHHAEANTDSLTGVLNRRALFGHIGETDAAAGLAVLMFDLDHFKQINDRLGHAHGDAVIQAFAGVMRKELAGNHIVARIGGEEFCAVLRGVDRDTARRSAEAVRHAFAGLNLSIGSPDDIATVSAGVALGGADEDFSSVLRRADDALYKAKSAGRDQVHLSVLRLIA